VIGTVDDEWMSCIDAITFIFQARTTAINNEKKGIKKKPKNKREQEIIYIHTHTSRFHNSTREFTDVYCS